jgi:Uma2 family endonuclease
MIQDPLLAQVPGKLELNEKGSIELTPPNNRHAMLQAFVASELTRLKPDGTTFTECSVETEIGVRVPDVAWASAEFMRRHGTTTPFPNAPELCVEVLSPSNTAVEIRDKVAAYLAAGAREVWVVAEDGSIEISNERGAQRSSVFGILVTPPR